MVTSRITDILLKAKVVDDLQVRSALARQSQWGGRVAKHIAEMGFASESAIADALAKALGLQRAELGMLPRDSVALSKVDVRFAEERGVFPVAVRDNGKTLWLAMADPTDLDAVDFVQARTGCRVRTTVAGEREIVAAIYRHYKNQAPPASLMGENNRIPTATAERLELEDFGGMQTDNTGARFQPIAQPTPAPLPRTPTPTPRGGSFPGFDVGDLPRTPTPLPRINTPPPRTAMPQPPAPTPPPPPRTASPAPLPRMNTPAPRSPTPALGTELPQDVIAALPPAAAEYLRRLQSDLDKTTRVLRGLVEVCVEKKVFSNDEIRTAIARLAGR